MTRTVTMKQVAFVLLIVGFAAARAESLPSDAGKQATSADAAELRLIEADPDPLAFAAGAVPRSTFIADDATLNDVAAIGQNCWAVGERGVICRSEDRGNTWSTQMLPLDCSLQSVCFLTDKIGYVAGHEIDQLNRKSRGIVLKTRDGGDSWIRLHHSPLIKRDRSAAEAAGIADLPAISHMRFFDLENGVAIASALEAGSHSSVFRTEDGGHSWTTLATDQNNHRMVTGAFLSAGDGIIAGHQNAYAAVVAQKVVSLAAPQRTLQHIRGVSLSRNGHGWLAGDGGFLLHSDNGGITWRAPNGKLSSQINEVLDYYSVAQNGSTVCAVGSPGGVVLHSPDNGKTWSFRRLSNPAPLKRMRFFGESHALAVGTFGVIHRSTNNGLSWQTVRNADYRTAVLCLTTDPETVSFPMLSTISGDEGFRSVVVQPSARLPRDGIDDTVAAQKMQTAVSMAGANDFQHDWMFARTQPLQTEVRKELLREWSQQTDARVGQLLPQRLAQLIRTYRPDVLCIDRRSNDDEVAKVWLQALEIAKQMAAGTDPRGEILTRIGLPPWRVHRIVVRLPDGDQSPMSFPADRLLPNLGTSTGLIADYCRAQAGVSGLTGGTQSPAADAACYAVYENNAAIATPSHILAGVMHAPESASRRGLRHVKPESRDILEKVAQADRLLKATLVGHTQTTQTPLSLIAHLKTVGRNLPEQLAMRRLKDLARLYERIENFESEIAVLKEITERFPSTPEAADAAEQLFQFYSSEELRFLRRGTSTENGGDSPLRRAAMASTDKTNGPRSQIDLVNGVEAGPEFGYGALRRGGRATSLGALMGGSLGADKTAIDGRWDNNAQKAMDLLTSLAPDRASSPRLLLRTAANLRRQGTFGENSTTLSQAAAGEGVFALLAQAELQSFHGAAQSPVPVVNLPKAKSRPMLDAVFSEECWQHAGELHLESSPNSLGVQPDCLIMITWDEEFVYLSGRIERIPGHANRLVSTDERHHDSDHADRDRVSFMFDTDRDYTTGFHFTIDESGQTSERCWRSKSWNPQWFVAADADEKLWRFEIAIPQEIMLARPLTAGELWSMKIHRVTPGRLQQSLTNSNDKTQSEDTQGYGLLRFIRNRK